MKKIYVDTENITRYNCLKELGITTKDEIILFLSNKSKPLKYDALDLIHSFNCKVKTIVVKVGTSNALDFSIVSYLGLKFSKKNDYVIVSNDKGYEAVLNFYDSQEFNNISLLNELGEINKIQGLPNELEIKKIIKDSKNKSELHSKLIKTYGDKGRELYHEYKQCIK